MSWGACGGRLRSRSCTALRGFICAPSFDPDLHAVTQHGGSALGWRAQSEIHHGWLLLLEQPTNQPTGVPFQKAVGATKVNTAVPGSSRAAWRWRSQPGWGPAEQCPPPPGSSLQQNPLKRSGKLEREWIGGPAGQAGQKLQEMTGQCSNPQHPPTFHKAVAGARRRRGRGGAARLAI